MERSFKGKTEYDVHVIQGKQHYILNYHPKGFLIHQYEVEKIDYAAQATN
ncbi:MAG TPA: hypothetical protein VG737_07075 [Cyclobacteriaceae bacterium]|nr:hypothetical protein [Cyclobacteriaceae bacterium]